MRLNAFFLLAKHKAAVTPMNPKKGAEVGQFSVEELILLNVDDD